MDASSIKAGAARNTILCNEDDDDRNAGRKECKFHIGDLEFGSEGDSSREGRESSAESAMTADSDDLRGYAASSPSLSRLTGDDDDRHLSSQSDPQQHRFLEQQNRPRTLIIPLKQPLLKSVGGGSDIGGSLPTGALRSSKKSATVAGGRRPVAAASAAAAVPRIRCQNTSAPATPASPSPAAAAEDEIDICEFLLSSSSSWTDGNMILDGTAGGERRGPSASPSNNDTSSIASIEEAQDAGLLSPDDAISVSSVDLSGSGGRRGSPSKYQRSLSRLSLNLAAPRECDRSPSPSPTLDSSVKSPSVIPRFLRNSFSRLLSRKPVVVDAASVVNPSPASAVESLVRMTGVTFPDAPRQQPFERGSDAIDAFANELSSATPPEVSGILPCSPSILDYFEETRLSGLPVIPFAYPTHVVAEKMREKNRRKHAKSLAGGGQQRTPSGEKAISSSKPKAIDVSRRPSVLDYVMGADGEPRSLENLVNIAERELARESLYGTSTPDRHFQLAAALVDLASSEGSSNSVVVTAQCLELDDDDDNDECLNSNTSFLMRESFGRDQHRDYRRRGSRGGRLSRASSEDDGYIEMIPGNPSSPSPSSSSPPPQRPWSSATTKSEAGRVKCLLARAESDEHFKMDFSSKG